MGLPRWRLSDKAERTFRYIVLSIVGLILVYEKTYGSSSTQYAAMYLCVFSLVGTYLSNAIQRRYFTYVTEYAQAFRIVALIMMLCFFIIWIYTTYERLVLASLPNELFNIAP
ncbi:hypothetical protein [Shewanella aestuarii]|uniref:Uncharacterized protein n=1 Tax=Shewanella aestuarii TaxID=1028752 RepID=A0A6G9QMM9_9GAMM|nr:hypothetical protein [Shewanella aestuarii]QIR15325.1 hypothetical protein HBH39_13195 [Shewanella aestuarii]